MTIHLPSSSALFKFALTTNTNQIKQKHSVSQIYREQSHRRSQSGFVIVISYPDPAWIHDFFISVVDWFRARWYLFDASYCSKPSEVT